jgi:hypothetical protein
VSQLAGDGSLSSIGETQARLLGCATGSGETECADHEYDWYGNALQACEHD